MKKIIKKSKRTIAAILTLVLVLCMIPVSFKADTQAATSSVKLSNLGKLGNITIGSHTKTGNWYQININGNYGFCMDLGKTLRTGDTFSSESKTYSTSDSSTKSKMFAYVTYWVSNKIDSKGTLSKREYQMAQSLYWSISEGYYSKSELVSVIQQVFDNGYSSNYTASGWYDNVLCGSDSEISAAMTYWTYTGSGQYRQHILEVTADTATELSYSLYSKEALYRQRINIFKEDEDGNRLSGVTFKIEAKNIDEINSFSVADATNEGGTVESETSNGEQFAVNGVTRANGYIYVRITYKLLSEEYAYIDDSTLSCLTKSQIDEYKEYLDEQGINYGSNLTYSEAVKKADDDIENQYSEISNEYVITEIATGDNYLLDNSWAAGKTVTITSSNSWLQDKDMYPEDDGWADIYYASFTGKLQADYPISLFYTVTNNFKKVKLSVHKVDKDTGESKPLGDASLEGAIFGIYSDSGCTKFATVYDSKGNAVTGTEETAVFTTEYNCDTDTYTAVSDYYVRCGTTYYIKEISAPTGYLLSDEVTNVYFDGADFENEFNDAAEQIISIYDDVITGKLEIIKISYDGNGDIVSSEEGAEFEVYLTSAGSYENASDLERDYITTDENGYASTKNLPYGEYTVHQTVGAENTYIVSDFNFVISEDGQVCRFILNNKPFMAYLRVTKIDANTGQTVLKPNTQYQIFTYDADTDTETLVTQSYSTGNKIIKASTWTTDESGIIVTYNPLSAGTYRVYEINAAEGYSRNAGPIEINITSSSYTIEYDEDGAAYYYTECVYLNMETYGKITIEKTGDVISGFDENTDEKFTYNTKNLRGVVFEIYAFEDIYTQDNQGSLWFKEGDLAATVTVGCGAEFSSECGGICGYSVDDETGAVTLTLPLGKYEIKEVSTLYGFTVSNEDYYDVEFVWSSQDDEYVYDILSCDINGTLIINNELAYGSVSVMKTDFEDGSPVEGAEYGLYTKDDLYASNGTLILEADALIDTLVTGADGYAHSSARLPLMSENYNDTATSDIDNSDENIEVYSSEINLNSGDYYIKEISAPEGYYISEDIQNIHLEYADEHSQIIYADAEFTDIQTEVVISKLSLADSKPVIGAKLCITDADGNEVGSWVTGDNTSLCLNADYADVYATIAMNEDYDVIISGLAHDKEYTLTETCPADGYITAESITFILTEYDGGTQALIKDESGEYEETLSDRITMYDDVTKVNIIKIAADTEEPLAGAELIITDSNDNIVASFTSSDEAYYIEKLVVGEIYTLTETAAPDGYNIAKPIIFTVEDTSAAQGIIMTDYAVESAPKTGDSNIFILIFLIIILICAFTLFMRAKAKYYFKL